MAALKEAEIDELIENSVQRVRVRTPFQLHTISRALHGTGSAATRRAVGLY